MHKFAQKTSLSANETALLKFILPNIFVNFNKILYLDGDIIVKQDLSELYNNQLENNYVAAVYDTGKLYYNTEFNIRYKDYFNSGVMLLNLDLLRKNNISDLLIKTKKESEDSNLMDQNVLNKCFNNFIKPLDVKYNFLILNIERAKKCCSIDEINKLFKSNYKNLNELKNKALIIHYSSKDKPWLYKNAPLAGLWYKYYKLSPWGQKKLERSYSISFPNKQKYVNKIFSVKNIETHKVFNIFGFKIKFKKTKLIFRQKAKHFEECLQNEHQLNLINNSMIKLLYSKNKVLIIEPNSCHSEMLPGIAKYMQDLGYESDIIYNYNNYEMDSLSRMDCNKFILERNDINDIINSGFVDRYDYIIFSSHITYTTINGKISNIFDIFPNLYKYKNKIFVFEHRLELLDQSLLNSKKVFALANLQAFNNNNLVCNTHYFGKIKITDKNEYQIRFISVGNLEKNRRNLTALINAVKDLSSNKFYNFQIIIIGKGELDNIPKNLRKYFKILGKIPYERMYQEMELADFFLPLLDPENPEHERYITTGTSGSFQLIYGFRKPCLIAKKFANTHFFNNSNSIIYNSNEELAKAMKIAIEMTNPEYLEMQKHLDNTANTIYEKSLNNLKNALYNTLPESVDLNN